MAEGIGQKILNGSGSQNLPAPHGKPLPSYSFDRLNMLWERYPQYHERTVFTTLDELLE